MYVKIEVTASARRESIERINDTTFIISVREKAERNQANRRVLELVRKEFGSVGVITRIISGHRSPHKIVSVEIDQ